MVRTRGPSLRLLAVHQEILRRSDMSYVTSSGPVRNNTGWPLEVMLSVEQLTLCQGETFINTFIIAVAICSGLKLRTYLT